MKFITKITFFTVLLLHSTVILAQDVKKIRDEIKDAIMQCDCNEANYQYKRLMLHTDHKPDNNILKQIEDCINKKKTTILSVSKDKLLFLPSGGQEKVTVNNNNSCPYSISVLPLWFEVQEYAGYFVVTCNANSESTTRDGYFTVTAGDKTVRISISQTGKIPIKDDKTEKNKVQDKGNKKDTAKAKALQLNTHGITLGYVAKQCRYYTEKQVGNGRLSEGSKLFAHGFRIGYAWQPQFNKGFGLTTGINLDFYKSNYDYDNYGNRYYFLFYEWSINLPLHIQYRINISKSQKAKIIFEAGPSFDFGILARNDVNYYDDFKDKEIHYYGKNSWNGYYPYNRFKPYIDFGIGFRYQWFQISAGTSFGLTSAKFGEDLKINASFQIVIPNIK